VNIIQETNMSNKLNSSGLSDRQRLRRYLVLGLLILSLGLAIYIGVIIRDNGPNYYSPGRAALVNAKQKFEESLVYEQALIEKKRMAHEEIILAINQLAKAEDLDAEDRARIEVMRARLLAIDKADYPGGTTPGQLQNQYREVLNEMDILISKTENYPR
jgi:hypothetical protein